LRLGAVSSPGGRNVHERSVPRLGGVAIAVAFTAPLSGLFIVDSAVATTFRDVGSQAVGLILGAIALCAVGFMDDTRGIRAPVKLAAQVAAACIAFACGLRIDAVYLPLLGDLEMGIFALPVTVAWIVGITNAVNLIDGLDGLAAGVVFFAAMTNLVVAVISGSIFVAVLMAATMGALVGFLFYNFNPARIFMGDSGSYFLGFVLATTSLAGVSQKASTAVSLLVPVVALGVPIFDTLFSMVRRIVERRSLFSPDRGHIHHRLLDMGITHRRAVLILYGVSVVFTVSAIGISLGRSWEVGVALLAATVVMVGLVRFVGYFEYLHLRRRQKSHFYDLHTERLRRQLPKTYEKLGACTSDTEVFDALAGFVEAAEFSFVEVLRGLKGDENQVFRHETAKSPTERGLVTARFPIGREGAARGSLKFGWHPDSEDVSPQADILLQLMTDRVEQRFTALRSPLAPLVAGELIPAEPPSPARVAPERAV
jgi:UDP-GlcNAc:undecaprenyl-phosphate/decaprenyl-phosphate GlcNAc-1-phosphate transferase